MAYKIIAHFIPGNGTFSLTKIMARTIDDPLHPFGRKET
jgi:hypothetical protein